MKLLTCDASLQTVGSAKLRGRLCFGEMENCLLEYLVYYGYLVLCLSWSIFAWSEWKNLERQQRICSNKLRFTSFQFAKFKTVHVIEFRPPPLAVHFSLFDEYSSPFPSIMKPFIRKCCIYIILLVMLVTWSRWLKDWKEWRIMQIG